MFAPEFQPVQTLSRVSLATIDKIVSDRLGTTRLQDNAQPAVFNRQIAMYLAKRAAPSSVGRLYRRSPGFLVYYPNRRQQPAGASALVNSFTL